MVVYFKPESVQLAIRLLDQSEFRLGDKGTMMEVVEADYSYKRVKDTVIEEQLGAGGGNNGKDEAGSTADKAAKAKAASDKKKIIARTQAMNSRLADWDDDDPQVLPETSSRWDKVVILKYMFTLAELEEDPAAIMDIKHDVREECEKLGEVTNVVLYDKEEQGVMSVRFGNAASATACVRVSVQLRGSMTRKRN
jgi:HIV Tat-specific factor 1